MKTTKLRFAKKLTFFAAIIMISLSACQKKDHNLTTGQSTNSTIQKTLTDDAENPANPFDYMGLAHNEGLHATRATWTNKSSTFTDMYTDVVTFVTNNYDPNVVPSKEADCYSIWSAAMADASKYEATLVANSSLSRTGQAYANQILTLCLNPNSTYTYDDLKNSIVAVESTIANDRTLSSSDKDELYKLASIGRYSVLYWVNESAGANGGSTLLRTCSAPTATVAAQAAKFNWLAAAVADLGAVVQEIGSGHGFWTSAINVVVASVKAGFDLK